VVGFGAAGRLGRGDGTASRMAMGRATRDTNAFDSAFLFSFQVIALVSEALTD